MKKRLSLLLSIAFLLIPVAAFGQGNLRMASNVVGSMSYTVASGLSAVYQKNTGQTMEVLTKELTATVPQLYGGGYEIAHQMNAAAYLIYNNYDLRTCEPTGSKERPAIRLVMMGNKATAGFLAYESSGMVNSSDMKGKRVTLRFGQFSALFMARINLIASGLTDDEVTSVQCSTVPKGAELLRDGTVDVTFGATTVPAFRELDVARPVRFLSHSPTPEIEKRMRAAFPGAVFVEVQPDPGLVGIRQPVTMVANHSVLISATNVSDDVIYNFVKTVYEHRQELVPYAPDFADWVQEPPASIYAAAPFHPGAIRYYREAGLWPAEMEQWNQQLLDVYK